MIRLIAFTALAIFSSIGAGGCQRSEDFPNGSLSDWKGAKEHILSPEEWQAEISEKMDRLSQRDPDGQAFLKEEGLRGVLLTRVRYVQWITAGLANTEIAQGSENGAGSLLIMDDGSKYLHRATGKKGPGVGSHAAFRGDFPPPSAPSDPRTRVPS